MKSPCWMLMSVMLLAGTVQAENLMYVSWGDHIMVCHGIAQLDTKAKIVEAIGRWHDNYGVGAMLWRLSDEIIRDEYECRTTAKFYHDYYAKVKSVYETCNPVVTAREAAHAKGMKFLLYETFLDHGCPTNVLYGDTVPFPWQDKSTILHPEWQERDLRGEVHWGVLDLSVPAARRLAIDRYVRFVKKYAADGIYCCDRTHSHPAEHADQFGFGPAVVAEYMRRYGIDITKDKRFDWRDPEYAPHAEAVENWRRLRGEYLVEFYRELRAALPGKTIYLALPKGDRMGAPYGNLHVDAERIVREGLADGIVLNVFSGRGLYPKDKVPHKDRGYLVSYDDGWNVDGDAEAIGRLVPACREKGVRLYYSSNFPVDERLDGRMLTFVYPHAAKLNIWDKTGALAGERFGFDGRFFLPTEAPRDIVMPRLVCKYGHLDHSMRGWEIYLENGKPVLRLHLVHADGKRGDVLVRSKSDMPRGRWTRVTADFDGAKGRSSLTVDGVETALPVSKGAKLHANPKIPIVFGAYSGGGFDAEMMVDDVTLRGGGDGTVVLGFESSRRIGDVTVPGVRIESSGQCPLVPGPHGNAWLISLKD